MASEMNYNLYSERDSADCRMQMAYFSIYLLRAWLTADVAVYGGGRSLYSGADML